MSGVDVRLLSGTMAKILLVFLFERGGMTIDELSYRTGVRDLKTLRLACKDFERQDMGLLVAQRGEHGKEVWMPAGALLPEVRDAYFPVPERGKPPLCIEMDENQNGGNPRSEDENEVILAPERGKPPLCKGSDRLIDINTNKINKINNLQSEPENENPKNGLPPYPKIIEGVCVLRGKKGDPDYLWESPSITDLPRETTAAQFLAWVVKAHGDRERLDSPVGMICRRLRSKTTRSLPKNWRERLPVEFLDEIGVEHAEVETVDNSSKILSAVERFMAVR